MPIVDDVSAIAAPTALLKSLSVDLADGRAENNQDCTDNSTSLPNTICDCIETFQQLYLMFVEQKVLENSAECTK